MSIMAYLHKKSEFFLMVLGCVLFLLVAAADYLSGLEFTVAIFYLLPVSMMSWYLGSRAGLAMSILSAMALYAVNTPNIEQFQPLAAYWNVAVTFGLLLTVVYTIASLRAKEEMQEEMAQFIVHDLRSPMTNLLTGMQTLQCIADEEMGETEKELIDMAITSSNRLLTLINSLLDVSKLESGELPIKVTEVHASELIEYSFHNVALWAEQNSVTLTPEVDPKLKSIRIDKELTERVLVNLLGNALKFSPADSTVTVKALKSHGEVKFCVADKGPGIPKEWAHKIFDKFAQIEARKAGAASTGLGLTFCRLAIEAQGGRIWVESELGKGSRFIFTLPLNVQKVQAPV